MKYYRNRFIEIILILFGFWFCALVMQGSFLYLFYGDRDSKIFLAVLSLMIAMHISYLLNEELWNKNVWREKQWELEFRSKGI